MSGAVRWLPCECAEIEMASLCADDGLGKIAFYETAATVIPVLLLGYVVEVAALARRMSQFVERAGEDARERVLVALDARLAG